MKEYILDLDRPRKLKFGFKATRLIEEKLGNAQLNREAFEKMQIHEFLNIIHAGLVWEDKDLTVEKLEDIIDQKIPEKYNITQLIDIVGKAFVDHLGGAKIKKKSTQEKKKKVSTKVPKSKRS